MNKMKKILYFGLVLLLTIATWSTSAQIVQAAAGASVSGGGTKTVGQNFTVTVTASGAEFDSLQGVISISGPVTIVSFAGGGATWLPGKAPANNVQFVGITNPTTKLTIASITLKGTKEGKGSVSVSSVKLARNGSYVGTSGGSTSFTITRALTPPGGVEVSSATHPDQNAAYEATTVELTWKAPSNGANGYSTAFDQSAETVPGTTITTKDTAAKYENLPIGTHYFHIRANNGDGWGVTTHFKINIKEPDPKVDDTLAKPSITSIEKNDSFATDITAGTVSGFTVSGNAPIGYVAILSFEARERLPQALFEPLTVPTETPVAPAVDTTPPTEAPTTTTEPKVVLGVKMTPLMAEPDETGSWRIPINAAIPSGFYKLTVQSQKEKVLTPVSDPAHMELSVAKGGTVRMITPEDINPPVDTSSVQVLGVTMKKNTLGWLGVVLANLLILGGAYVWWRWRSRKSAGPTTKQLL